MSEPRTEAGRRLLSAIADHADLLRHDPANGLPLGLSYILAIEDEALAAYRRDLAKKVRGLPVVLTQWRCWWDHDTTPHRSPHNDGTPCPDAAGPKYQAVRLDAALALIESSGEKP